MVPVPKSHLLVSSVVAQGLEAAQPEEAPPQFAAGILYCYNPVADTEVSLTALPVAGRVKTATTPALITYPVAPVPGLPVAPSLAASAIVIAMAASDLKAFCPSQ
jgi:hypothetical protein